MKRKDSDNQSCRGAMMLESLIVYIVTIFLLFFVLAIFSVFYQRWILQTIANESVTRMAQTYRWPEAYEQTGAVEKGNLTDTSISRVYRYTLKNEERLAQSVEDRISEYAGWRILQSTYARNIIEPEINAEVTRDALGRRHIEVTITGMYAVPMGEALTYFGFDSAVAYDVKAYAACVDIIEYINLVNFVDSKTSLDLFGSSFIGLIDKVLALFDNIFD